MYTEICNSVYNNKLQSKNNLQILHSLLTKKLLESAENYEIVELHIDGEKESEPVLEMAKA